MANTSGEQYAVGMRHARVYNLDQSLAVPKATSTSVYEGLQIVGARAFELTIPDPRRIAHVGDDQVLATDMLPRQEPSSGVLRAARNDHDVVALLSGTTAFVVGESAGVGYGTSEQGSEPIIFALCYQQAKDASTGARRYRAYFVLRTQAIINPNSMNENAAEFEYNLLPSASSIHIWGSSFASGTEGFTSAEILEFMTEDIPHVAAWQGDGSETEFTFDTDRQATSTDKIHAVYSIASDGTATDESGETLAVTGITFGVAPTNGDYIVCFYEYAD